MRLTGGFSQQSRGNAGISAPMHARSTTPGLTAGLQAATIAGGEGGLRIVCAHDRGERPDEIAPPLAVRSGASTCSGVTGGTSDTFFSTRRGGREDRDPSTRTTLRLLVMVVCFGVGVLMWQGVKVVIRALIGW